MMRIRNSELWGILLPLLAFAALGLALPRFGPERPASPAPGLEQDGKSDLFPRLRVGAPAPDTVLMDDAGEEYRLSYYRGRKVLVCAFCDCSRCRDAARAWEKIHQGSPELTVLGVSAAGPGAVFGWRDAKRVTFPLLFDPNYHFAQPSDVMECPRAWVIDAEGRVVAQRG
jgi:peroxiredoxin